MKRGMTVMSKSLRAELEVDPRKSVCAFKDIPGHVCGGRITREHAMYYAGKKIQESAGLLSSSVRKVMELISSSKMLRARFQKKCANGSPSIRRLTQIWIASLAPSLLSDSSAIVSSRSTADTSRRRSPRRLR